MEDVIRLNVSEAAKLFGVSTATVRRALAQGQLRYVVVRGRYKINFESLVAWSHQFARIRNKRDRTGIGQFVSQWKIKNTLFSPDPTTVKSDVAHTSNLPPDAKEERAAHSPDNLNRGTVLPGASS